MQYEYVTINQAARLIGISETFLRESGKMGTLKIEKIDKEKIGHKLNLRPLVAAISRVELAQFVERPCFKRAKRIVAQRRGIW